MEFQIIDNKGQNQLNYVNEDPLKVAIKAHEWAEFNYGANEVRINYISDMMSSKSVNQLMPDELRLLIVSDAIDYVDEDSSEFNIFFEMYEKIFCENMSIWINKTAEYCRFLDSCGYLDSFKILYDEED